MELRVLFVDDSADDVELMLRRLCAGGMEVVPERVETGPALREALAARTYEVALVDYNLPGFDGIQALHTLGELVPDLPAITVSGAITEDTAVATLSAGAVDYVLKDNLARLAPAVQRAIEGAELRRRQRHSAEQARLSQFAVDHASQTIVYVSEAGVILYVNLAAERLGGLPRERAVGQTIWNWSPLVSEPAKWAALWAAAGDGPIVDLESPVTRPDGRRSVVLATLERLQRDEDSFMIIYARDVTEQREAEERARETEERYGRLTDTLPDVVFRCEVVPEFRFEYVNPAIEAITGYSPAEFYADGQLLFRIMDREYARLVAERIATDAVSDEPEGWRLSTKSGALRHMQTRLVPIRDADGSLVAVEGVTRDVTEILRATEELAHSRNLLDYVVSHARSAIAIHDRDLNYIYVSERYLSDYGLEGQDVIGRHHHEVFPDLPQKWRDVHQRALAGEVLSADKDPYPREDGSVVWTRWECRPWWEADGAIGGIIVYTEVITESVLAEQALRESQAQLRTLVDTLPDLVWLKDPEGIYLSCNRRFESFFGSSEQAIVGKTDHDFLPADLADFFRLHDKAAMDAGAPTANEEEIVFAGDGHREILETIKTPVFSSDGQLMGVLGVGRDITGRKQAEASLRQSEERFRRVSQSTTDFAYSCVKEADGPFTFDWLSGAVERITGYSEAELHDWGCWKRLVVDEDVPVFEARVTGLSSGESGACELRIRRRDGSERWLASYAEMTVDADAPARHRLFGACQDISERKSAEEETRRSRDLLANVARLVPGVVYQYRLYPDGSSAFPYSSPGMNDIYEYAPEDVREDATPVFGRLHPDDAERVSEDIFRSARTLETFHCEFRVILPRQGLRWRWSQAHPERTEDGGTLWHGIISDITDRKLAEEAVLHHAERLRRTVEGAVLAMSHVVETRDPYTAGHERRVAELAVAIATELGLDPAAVEGLRLASLIHDIGKIAVPAEILAKPGRLSDVEFTLIRQHAESGFEILAPIEFDAPVADIVLQHHERMDGSGYPQGLAGEQILREARILAVADTVEAMSSHRPYRAALGMDAALDEVRSHAGTGYDAEVAAACLRVVEEQGFTFAP